MRVRTGKSIKTTNLLSSFNKAGTGTTTGGFMVSSNEGGFKYQASVSNVRKFGILNGHKYFLCARSEFALDSFVFMSSASWYQALYTSSAPTYADSYSYVNIENVNADNENIAVLVWCKNHASWTVYNGIVIDLTSTFGSGKEPTAQQFYNKYKDKLELLATGNEIVIDSKGGKIDLFPKLPNDFQEVEYIESTGAQYIDTSYQVAPNYNYSFESKAALTVNTYMNFFATFGSENSTGSLLGFGSSSSYDKLVGFFYAISGLNSNVARDLNAHIYKVRYNKNINNSLYLEVDNTGEVSYTSSAFNTYPYATSNLTLLGVPNANTGYNQSKLYYFKLKDSNNLLYDLVPCYHKYTGQIGLYNLVGNSKNLCPYIKATSYTYSNDYLKYNQSKAVFLPKGTYTFSCSNQADVGFYLQTFAKNDTTTNVLITTSITAKNKGGYTWDNKGLNIDAGFGSLTFTLGDDYIVTICSKQGQADILNPQFEKGETATTYERGKFYTNAGTGTFSKGNNVNNYLSCNVAVKEYGYNQLAEYPQTSGTKWYGYNCTMTASAGVFTCVANGNNYPACASQFYNIIYTLDHIYLHLAKFKQDSAVTGGTFSINTNGMSTKLSGNSTTAIGEWVELYYFGKGLGSSQYNNTFNIQGSTNAVSGATFYVKDAMCIDLTDWYGPGKEPTTVQEFKEKFSKDYYGFCKNKIRLTEKQINALPVYGYNQIANINRTSTTIRGITFVNNDNNTLTITGTSQQADNISIGSMQVVEGHKYYGFTNVMRGTLSSSTYWIKWVTANYGKDVGEGVWFTATSSSNPAYCSLYVEAANVKLDAKVQMMLIDLTDWYGAGSEPSTVAEFKATFPYKYYQYCKKSLLNKYQINALGNN